MSADANINVLVRLALYRVTIALTVNSVRVLSFLCINRVIS